MQCNIIENNKLLYENVCLLSNRNVSNFLNNKYVIIINKEKKEIKIFKNNFITIKLEVKFLNFVKFIKKNNRLIVGISKNKEKLIVLFDGEFYVVNSYLFKQRNYNLNLFTKEELMKETKAINMEVNL